MSQFHSRRIQIKASTVTQIRKAANQYENFFTLNVNVFVGIMCVISILNWSNIFIFYKF
jgi:hypothetical protein